MIGPGEGFCVVTSRPLPRFQIAHKFKKALQFKEKIPSNVIIKNGFMQIENFIYNENNRILILEDGSKVFCKDKSSAISKVTKIFKDKIIDEAAEALNLDPDRDIYNELYFRLISHITSENWIDSLGFIINRELPNYIKWSHSDYELFSGYYNRSKTIYDHFIIHQNKPFKMIEKRSKQVDQLSLFI